MEKDWQLLMDRLSGFFDQEPDINAILFLMGLQESGQIEQVYSKEQKVALIQLGLETALACVGYYEMSGRDENGWPEMTPLKKVLTVQEEMLKEGILRYFTAPSSW